MPHRNLSANQPAQDRTVGDGEVAYWKHQLAKHGITTDKQLRMRFREPEINPLYMGLLHAREIQSGVCFRDYDG